MLTGLLRCSIRSLPGAPAILAAATRHLAWELRTERAEAYILDPNGNAQQIFCSSNSDPAPLPISKAVIHLLKKRAHLSSIADVARRQDRPLFEYMETRGFNVIAPIVSKNKLLGWLALGLEDSRLTVDFLDDLSIATHLLSMCLSHSHEEMGQKPSPWHLVLTAFQSGMLILSREGEVIDCVGETFFLGCAPRRGESFEKIRSGRIREVIAEAMRGNFTTASWIDPKLEQPITCASTALADESIALHFGILQANSTKNLSSPSDGIELTGLLESLPLPVIPDGTLGSSSVLPSGRISTMTSEDIRRCANAAVANNVKTLRLRYQPRSGSIRAVLFYESPSGDAESHLGRDIEEAVQFVVTPA